VGGDYGDHEDDEGFYMAERVVILPDARLEGVKGAAMQAVAAAAGMIGAETFEGLLDPVIRGVVTGGGVPGTITHAGADEGTIWLADEEGEALVIAFNSGPNAGRLVNQYRQPLTAGLVSLVYASGRPLCEHGVYRNQSHDPTLDTQLKVRTCAMIVTPLYYGQQSRGVISCVQLQAEGSEGPEPAGFSHESLAVMELCAASVGRLIDYQLLTAVLGRG
jgi:hypothetical protein